MDPSWVTFQLVWSDSYKTHLERLRSNRREAPWGTPLARWLISMVDFPIEKMMMRTGGSLMTSGIL